MAADKIFDPIMLKLFPTIDYPDRDLLLGKLDMNKRHHGMCRVISYPGSGKTTLLTNYLNHEPSAVLITPSRNCRDKDLLINICLALKYIPGKNLTANGLTLDLISHIKSCGKEIVFLIDEAQHLIPRSSNYNIDRLDLVRYIWDFTKLTTSVVFAGTNELEGKIKRANENLTNSQFYRRCLYLPMENVPINSIAEFIHNVEKDFCVFFDKQAFENLKKRFLDTTHAGIGNSIEILSICMTGVYMGYWDEFYKSIEQGEEYNKAIKLFAGLPIKTITGAMINEAAEMHP
ncbi:hypothetical protein FACS1894184_18850 [Clostridia bacterium]|nr:hypothetical protein FACS1894184_18850 [Clostridia bacterium]